MALASRMKGKKKKDLSKINCFNCGEMGHFLSRCPNKKKGDDGKRKGKQASLITNKAEMDYLARRLEDEEEDFSMISHFSQSTIKEDGWYMDSGAMKHMIGSQDIFETLVGWDSKLHMVLGDKTQLEIRGSGVVPFRMETGCMMRSRIYSLYYVSDMMCSLSDGE